MVQNSGGEIMYNHVDWNIDFAKYLPILRAEYNKCNIWPRFEDECEFTDALKEEVKEANKNMEEVALWMEALARTDNDKPELKKIAIIRGHAIKTILECLHVIAVCDKRENDSK